jgi:hypothetical protein
MSRKYTKSATSNEAKDGVNALHQGRRVFPQYRLDPVAVCGFPKESEWKYDHVHNCAHKKMAQSGTDCRRLAQMRSELLVPSPT